MLQINARPAADRRKGFTLIELLVVIAIIAILAAILFPVFQKVRENARRAACLSNMKQMGTATIQYNQDYDESYYAHRYNCPGGGFCNPLAGENGGPVPVGKIVGQAQQKTFWISILQPYIKSYDVFKCPSAANAWTGYDSTNPTVNCAGSLTGANGCGGVGYGGQNSYGHNDAWMSPAGGFLGTSAAPYAVTLAQVDRPAGTILITDSTYYGVCPDVQNKTGLLKNAIGGTGDGACTAGGTCNSDAGFLLGQGGQYVNYWKNIGNANWSWGGATLSDSDAIPLLQTRHNQLINCQFVDGHVKAIRWEQVVGDICLWATNANGNHPNCN